MKVREGDTCTRERGIHVQESRRADGGGQREDEEASSRQNSGGVAAHLKGEASSSVAGCAEGHNPW